MDRRPEAVWRHDVLNALNVIEAATFLFEHHAEGMSDDDRTEIVRSLRNGVEQLRELLNSPSAGPPSQHDP